MPQMTHALRGVKGRQSIFPLYSDSNQSQTHRCTAGCHKPRRCYEYNYHGGNSLRLVTATRSTPVYLGGHPPAAVVRFGRHPQKRLVLVDCLLINRTSIPHHTLSMVLVAAALSH
ncbi:hypothetical protein PAXRUDRAFT_758283 [Paxillus rubicundulus Ve08.2h10]|uniref:Uncharacterized protein n=1 Tax=Paxillus rubicundulus Ve08.2h10 TaxID=930991 RepID=A0A0D0E7M8_9AGAM|nr:hypothetical protein PAXRUDRAFT_758283 [Paxillus rubicundulus Ve08.2h10]